MCALSVNFVLYIILLVAPVALDSGSRQPGSIHAGKKTLTDNEQCLGVICKRVQFPKHHTKKRGKYEVTFSSLEEQ